MMNIYEVRCKDSEKEIVFSFLIEAESMSKAQNKGEEISRKWNGKLYMVKEVFNQQLEEVYPT